MIQHLAIIMDGNGRWAQKRGLSRSQGHRAGAEAIVRTAEAAMKRGIKYLTLYAFSTENWKRPAPEVEFLMHLIPDFISSQLNEVIKNGVRLRTIGRTDDLPEYARKPLLEAIEACKNNDKLTLNLALSYGGRAEIVDAVNKMLASPDRPEKITEQNFVNYLYAPDIPDPDLMIRTSGEMRLSNFLLWELSYSELYVTDTLWPDFGEKDIDEALQNFAARDRRFGGVKK